MCVANPNRKAVRSRGRGFIKLGHWWNVRQTQNSNLSPRNHEWQKQQDDSSYNEGGFDPNPESSVWRIVNGSMSGGERDHGYSYSRLVRSILFILLPKTKAADKGVAVVAPARGWRQGLNSCHIPTPENDIVRFQGVLQSFHDFEHMMSPVLYPQTLQAGNANVILVGLSVFVWKVPQLHRHNDTIDDHG